MKPLVGNLHGATKSCAGAASELAIAADLLKRGLFVFRTVSDNSPADLVVMSRDGRQTWSVECKTGRKHPASGRIHAAIPGGAKPFDVLAAACPVTGAVEYWRVEHLAWGKHKRTAWDWDIANAQGHGSVTRKEDV
jgi:hypothetical protein